MKSLELKPTHENLLNTLIYDTIGRNRDVCFFADMINSFSDSCSVALDGGWGKGKTFFVKQTKMLLDAHNPFVKSMSEEDCLTIKSSCCFKNQIDFEPQVSVYYDAWENDNDSEPMLSLIYSIVSSINTDFKFSNNTTFLEKAATILELFTDKDWKKVIDSFKGSSPFEEINKDKDFENEIKEFLDDLLVERGNRLVIFIDELDRCNPSYAVKLLERIKHYFDNDRITFVFAINTLELQHTIKKHYGENFDACRYLDRFFDIKIAIPEPDLSLFYKSIDFDNKTYIFDCVCDKIIKKYNLSFREITKFIRITKMAAYEATHGKGSDFMFPEQKAVRFCLMYIMPLMIGLNIYNRVAYENFISGHDYKPLTELFANEDARRFSELLTSKESFYEDDANRTTVSVEDKLIEVYNALFVTEYDRTNEYTLLGQYTFSEKTKTTLFKVVGLFSEYTNLFYESEEVTEN